MMHSRRMLQVVLSLKCQSILLEHHHLVEGPLRCECIHVYYKEACKFYLHWSGHCRGCHILKLTFVVLSVPQYSLGV